MVTAVRWASALTHVPLGVILNHLALVDGPDAKLALDSCNERWALEQGSGQGLQGLQQGWTQTMDRLRQVARKHAQRPTPTLASLASLSMAS